MDLNRWTAAGLWIFSTLSLAVWMEIVSERNFSALLHFAVLLGLWLTLSDGWVRKGFHSRISPHSVSSFSLVLVLLLYLWFTAWAKSLLDLDLLLSTLLFCLVPFLLLLATRPPSRFQIIGQAVAAVAIWIPVEMSWLPQVELAGGFPVTMTGLLVLVFAFYLFLVAFPMEGIGYTFEIRTADWSFAARYFSLFTAFLAIPLALLLDFAAPSSIIPGFEEWPVRFLAIFFFVALPEEFLFRGIFQNLLEKIWPSTPIRTLVLASVLFGLSHANNANPPYLHVNAGPLNLQLPWVYIVLATLAGIFYGLTYRRTGKITVAAVVHALVDFYWSIFFSGEV